MIDVICNSQTTKHRWIVPKQLAHERLFLWLVANSIDLFQIFNSDILSCWNASMCNKHSPIELIMKIYKEKEKEKEKEEEKKTLASLHHH